MITDATAEDPTGSCERVDRKDASTESDSKENSTESPAEDNDES